EEKVNEKQGDNRKFESLSTFEQLPKEIMWLIFDHASQSVFDLRLTSRTVSNRIDKYANQETTDPLVDKFTILFHHPRVAGSRLTPGMMKFTITVPTCKSALFELRLKLNRFPFLHGPFPASPYAPFVLGRFRRHYSVAEAESEYEVYLGDADQMKLVVECVGRRIGSVFIRQNTFNVASRVLEGTKFGKLGFSIITNDDVSCLMNAIKLHDVDHLLLYAGDDMSITNQVSFLLGMASLLRSLCIIQRPANA
ncbi:hypothetical protein PENTCL1PPCAC_8197, partial [Pristionchus entomophagus]